MRGCDERLTSDAGFGTWDQAKAYVAWLYRKVKIKIAKPFVVGKFEVTGDDREAVPRCGAATRGQPRAGFGKGPSP